VVAWLAKLVVFVWWSVLSVHLCFGAWISEIQPDPRQVFDSSRLGMVTIPGLIEITGLGSLANAQVVVISADPQAMRYGMVLQAITVPIGADVRVILEHPVTDDPLPFDIGSTGSGGVTIVSSSSDLGLHGPRTILLFDRPTGLIPGSGRIQDLVQNTDKPTLLDAVTFVAEGGLARSYTGEPVLELLASEAITRPMRTPTLPWDDLYFVGVPGPDGLINDHGSAFPLNPTFTNLVWQGLTQDIPVPTTLGSFLLLLAAYLCDRRMGRLHA